MAVEGRPTMERDSGKRHGRKDGASHGPRAKIAASLEKAAEDVPLSASDARALEDLRALLPPEEEPFEPAESPST
jgi:hypothetical protein